MRLTLLLLTVLLATGADAQVFGPESSQGTVAVNIGSADVLDVGVRYWIGDGVSVGASWSESTFEDVNEGLPVRPSDGLEVDARTLAVIVEGEWLRLGNRFVYSNGVQAFGRRQVNDVVVGYGADFAPVIRPDGRSVDVVGIGFSNRYDLRLAGPLWVGFQGGLFGLRVERSRGGVEVRDGVLIDLEGETSTRLKLGGPARFYLAVQI